MTKATEVHNGMELIDSRDVIKRIEELTEFKNAALEAATEATARIVELEGQAELDENDEDELDTLRDSLWVSVDNFEYGECVDWTETEAEELKQLEALADDAGGCADWKYGEGLIRDSYFQEYAEQLAEDTGAIGRDAKWPCDHIDWEAAAEALQQGYTSVEYDGVTYWIRS